MHSGPFIGRPLARCAAVAAFAWVAATTTGMADQDTKVTPAKVSSKQGSEGGPASSKPKDVKEELILPGGGTSGAPGIDIPPPQSLTPNQRMDPRMRKKMMEEADRRRNWMFDDKNTGTTGDRSKGTAADRKKGTETKPIEFESSRQRTLMEKRVAGDDETSKKEQASREERQAKDRQRVDPTKKGDVDVDSDPDADLKEDKLSRDRTKAGDDRENRPFQQAVFSDPFTAGRAATTEESNRTPFGGNPGPSDGSKSGNDPVSSRLQSERMDSILGHPGGQTSSRSDSGIFGDFGGQRGTRAQQFNELLGGSDSGSTKSGLLDSSKAPAASRAFGSGSASGSLFGTAGGAPAPSSLPGSAFSTPAAPRPAAPLVKPQPGVLPFPTRTF